MNEIDSGHANSYFGCGEWDIQKNRRIITSSAGTTVRSTVDDWSEFKQGPRLSEDHFESFRGDLVKKGYLAFEQEHDDLKYHTAFRVLSPRYFADFDRFVRCQDIPDSYFGQVIPDKSCFVSHR
jgi:hypothetical protein